jgi:hypothetical protein
MKFKFLRLILVGVVLSMSNLVNAGLIGVDLKGEHSSWNYYQTSNNIWLYNDWTLGFDFEITSSQKITKLGFWDFDNVFGDTSVRLWTYAGDFLGVVSTTKNSVEVVKAANGFGYWNFMDFDFDLTAGRYIIGARGEDLDYAVSSIGGNLLAQNELEYKLMSWGHRASMPNNRLDYDNYYVGSNIMFQQVPEPSTLAIFALGMIGLASRRFKKQ